jgi:hypothetical protein
LDGDALTRVHRDFEIVGRSRVFGVVSAERRAQLGAADTVEKPEHCLPERLTPVRHALARALHLRGWVRSAKPNMSALTLRLTP